MRPASHIHFPRTKEDKRMPRPLHPNAPLIGVPGGRHLLDTPALLIDLPAMTRNIERMAAFAKARGIGLGRT
jgi:3-hydroxy-D-aspartate aldolase